MKDLLTDANFPRTADLRVYHLGVKPGEVANRLITVGNPSRARTVASFFDQTPEPFELFSERGFLTLTGRYKNVPVSVVSIGMGSPNMDFFVRETRECIWGDMVVIRLGSCGALEDVPVATVVLPEASVQISRNVDFNFLSPEDNTDPPYRVSKLAFADRTLYAELLRALERARPSTHLSPILGGRVNASADSFYSSQGRQTSFLDYNTDLIEHVKEAVPKLATLEMETFHLYHLAACWKASPSIHSNLDFPPPLASYPAELAVSGHSSQQSTGSTTKKASKEEWQIRAAAAHMVFASRTSQDFITPKAVNELESWATQATLEALVAFHIPDDHLHEEKGSVWQASQSTGA